MSLVYFVLWLCGGMLTCWLMYRSGKPYPGTVKYYGIIMFGWVSFAIMLIITIFPKKKDN